MALQAQAERALEQALAILQADDWRRVDTQDGDELCVSTAGGRTVWKYKVTLPAAHAGRRRSVRVRTAALYANRGSGDTSGGGSVTVVRKL